MLVRGGRRMALMPPSDFRPPLERPAAEPTLDELLDLWTAQERRRSQRAREAEWQRVQNEARRTAQGEIIARKGEANLPGLLRDEASFGRHARAALRAEASFGRVWSIRGRRRYLVAGLVRAGRGGGCRAMENLATARAGRARMLPGDVAGHRVGWFPDSGLVFAEGHPAHDRLACPDDLPAVLLKVEDSMCAADIPVSADLWAGVRRLDAAVDLATDSRAEGL